MQYEHIKHSFEPIFDQNSRILILGSLPSVKSREQNFYYGHPQNRFWKVTSAVFSSPLPKTTEEKTAFLLKNKIALWDVIAECDICGSSDAAIKNVVPTDLDIILGSCNIEKIYTNGAAAAKIFNKYQKDRCTVEMVQLPSTSPANAAWSLERLIKAWEITAKKRDQNNSALM